VLAGEGSPFYKHSFQGSSSVPKALSATKDMVGASKNALVAVSIITKRF
jgi:hypothetical protein